MVESVDNDGSRSGKIESKEKSGWEKQRYRGFRRKGSESQDDRTSSAQPSLSDSDGGQTRVVPNNLQKHINSIHKGITF